MTCLIISNPSTPNNSQKRRKNGRQRRTIRAMSPAYGEEQTQPPPPLDDDVLTHVDVLIGARDVLASMQTMLASKESQIPVIPGPSRPPRHTPQSTSHEPPQYQNFKSTPSSNLPLPTRRAPPPPPSGSISLDEPNEDPPDLPMDNIVTSKKGDPYISMRFSKNSGGQLVDSSPDRPSTSSEIMNSGYERLTPGPVKDIDKPLPQIPGKITRRRQTSDSDTEVEQNLVKFREWDQQKQGPSNIGITAYEYRASKKDEISFKRGSVVEVIKKESDVKGFAYAEVEGKRGIIPKKYVEIIGVEGRQIDPKMLEKGPLIGDGGFSAVFRANYSGREVAMKMPKLVNRTFQQIRDALKQEAAFLNLFNHPNIVGFIGVSLTEPLCILLELCEGQSLKRLCKEAKNVPTKTITIWGMHVANGMRHMHSQTPPVLHRDLKADNILVKEKPCLCGQDSEKSKSPIPNYDVNGVCRICHGLRLEKLTLKIADMGLARTQSTARQSYSGSTPWMAPEFIKSQIMTTKSEVWSFGVFLWELITKETPYMGTDAQTLLFAIGMGWISLPIPENCPKELKEILTECWHTTVDLRPSFDRIILLLEHAQNNLDSNYRIILNTKSLHEKTKYDIEEFLNYVNSNKIDFMSALPINQKLEQIPESGPPVERKGKKGNKKKGHIDKLDISAPIEFKHFVSVRPSQDEEDESSMKDRVKQKLNIIKYYEEHHIETKRRSKDDLDAGRKTPDPMYDTSTLPRAKLGTGLTKRQGSDGNLSRNSMFKSTPDLYEIFKSDPAKIPQREFTDGVDGSEDMLNRELSYKIRRKPAFRRKKHHSGSSNNSLAMMNHEPLVAIHGSEGQSGGGENGFVLNSSLDDASSIILTTATNSPVSICDIRDGLVEGHPVVEVATEYGKDYTERRARLHTIDCPADVVATPRRAARTSSSNSHSTFYLTLDEHGRTGSYSSLQEATVEVMTEKHHSCERGGKEDKDKKRYKFKKIMKKFFQSSTDKSEADVSYHSKQSSADQSSILSVDQVEYIQETIEDDQDLSKIKHAVELPALPLRDFVSHSPQGRSTPQVDSSQGAKHTNPQQQLPPPQGSSTPLTGQRKFQKNHENPAKVRQRLRTETQDTGTPSSTSLGTPTSLLRTPPTTKRFGHDSNSPTTPSRSPSGHPRLSIDTVLELHNTHSSGHLPSSPSSLAPTLNRTIPSPTSIAPRLDRNLATSASNLHRLDSPDQIPVETYHQRSKSSDQTEATKVHPKQESMILFDNPSYVRLDKQTYQQMKQFMKSQEPISNHGYLQLNPKTNEKAATLPRPPAPMPTIVPTLPMKLPPAKSPMSDYGQDLKPPPIPPRSVGGTSRTSSTSILNVVVDFPATSPTSPCGSVSHKPSRPEPSPSRLHSPPPSMSTPPTPPQRSDQPPPQRPRTLNLRPSHSPRTPDSGLASTIPSSATNESLINVVYDEKRKAVNKNAKDTLPRKHDYIMLNECSNTIPASHFKSHLNSNHSTPTQKPIPTADDSKHHKKYQIEQHPKAQQRIYHPTDLPRGKAPPVPVKNGSPKPVKVAPEETTPRKVPPIPMTLKDRNVKK